MDDGTSAIRMVCHTFGDVEDLTTTAGPVPVAGLGQVLLDVTAAGVGFVDALIVRGLYQVRPPLPFTPGSVVAGRVAAVGDGAVGRFRRIHHTRRGRRRRGGSASRRRLRDHCGDGARELRHRRVRRDRARHDLS